MENQELAKIFYEMAVYLEMMDEVVFKFKAYEKAGQSIEGLAESVEEIYKRGGIKALMEIPGIGKNIAEKISEYLRTGKIREYLQLKKKIPVDLGGLMKIEGVGPKKIKVLYKKLKIRNAKELEIAAKKGKISKLKNFGEKSEKNILESIEFLKRSKGRFLISEILPVVREIVAKLKSLKEVKQISLAGSLRRMKETIGDADILAVANKSDKVMDYFVSLPGVVKIWGKGATKSSVRMKHGFDVDLRVVPEKSFGSALQYFTGSKEHNIATRKIAIEKGFKLNEYGIKTEKEVYARLGLPYIEPELRENTGEIKVALKNKLPKLVELKDIHGDLQIHSTWSDGVNSIKEMAETAQKIGYEYIAITDHVGRLKIAGAMAESQIKRQWQEIDKLNKSFGNPPAGGFKILKGAEVDINPDGTIACDDKILSQFDVVLGSLHSSFKIPKEKMTKRLVRAMENPYVDIIAHPTTRLIARRDEVVLDWEEIFKIAKRTGTILEINAYPARLDLKDVYIKQAIEAGVILSLGTDSHEKSQLHFMEYGVSQARRGWAEKKNIVNCWPLDKLLNFLK